MPYISMIQTFLDGFKAKHTELANVTIDRSYLSIDKLSHPTDDTGTVELTLGNNDKFVGVVTWNTTSPVNLIKDSFVKETTASAFTPASTQDWFNASGSFAVIRVPDMTYALDSTAVLTRLSELTGYDFLEFRDNADSYNKNIGHMVGVSVTSITEDRFNPWTQLTFSDWQYACQIKFESDFIAPSIVIIAVK